MAAMGWAGWESCTPTSLTSVLMCVHSIHQLPDIRQVPTFHICSGNFLMLTIIKWEWGKHMAQRSHREPPPISCQQYQWTKAFLTSIYPALLKVPWCRTAASRLSGASPPSLLRSFLLKSDLHFPCCNLLLFIWLTADKSQAIPSLQQAFTPSRVTQTSQETWWQLPVFQLALPHPIS